MRSLFLAVIKALRGRHSSTEPELGWDVSLCIPGKAGIPLAKLLIFNKLNLFCISYHNERNTSRPNVKVVSICVCVLGLWHQTGQHKQLSLLHGLVTRDHGSERASVWHVGVSLPQLPRPQKHQGGRDWLCGRADTSKDPRSICFYPAKLDNSFNLFILKTLKDNTNSSCGVELVIGKHVFSILPQEKYPLQSSLI